MMMRPATCFLLFLSVTCWIALDAIPLFAQAETQLRAGASRVNITPPSDGAFRMGGYAGRTEGFTGIHDSLYYRTIVVDDGRSRAAIITGDLLFTTDEMWENFSERIERETGIPRMNLLLAATHTHGAPVLARAGSDDESLNAYTEEVAGKVVVPWTSGAAGDQNPIYAVRDELNGFRIGQLDVLGRIVGEEVIRTAEKIDRMTNRARVRSGQGVVRLPGKERNEFRPAGDYRFETADSVDVRLSTLMIGSVVFGGVSGEVLTGIGTRFKEESPFSESIMITHCNGSSGYLADDRAYEKPGYEIAVTRVKEGAERGIVNGLIEQVTGH